MVTLKDALCCVGERRSFVTPLLPSEKWLLLTPLDKSILFLKHYLSVLFLPHPEDTSFCYSHENFISNKSNFTVTEWKWFQSKHLYSMDLPCIHKT